MVDGKQQTTWQHTSTVLAMIANVNRDPKKTATFKPDDFNPFAPKNAGTSKVSIKTNNIEALKILLPENQR